MDIVNYSELDPGICEVVRRLNAAKFTTTDSGDGVTKTDWIASGEALDFPHVQIAVAPDELVSESIRLKQLVESWGLCVEPVGRSPIWIQATFDPTEGEIGGFPMIMLAGVKDSALR